MEVNSKRWLIHLILMVFLGGIACTSPQVKDTAELKGTWVVKSVTWCGDPLPLGGEEDKPVRWMFSDDTFKSFVGLERSANEGTYRIDPKQAPKHLDLTTSDGEAPGTRKCIYSLEGDDLKI